MSDEKTKLDDLKAVVASAATLARWPSRIASQHLSLEQVGALLIGAIFGLVEQGTAAAVLMVLPDPRVLFATPHAAILRLMFEAADRGERIEPLALAESAKQRGQLALIGGLSALAKLDNPENYGWSIPGLMSDLFRRNHEASVEIAAMFEKISREDQKGVLRQFIDSDNTEVSGPDRELAREMLVRLESSPPEMDS